MRSRRDDSLPVERGQEAGIARTGISGTRERDRGMSMTSKLIAVSIRAGKHTCGQCRFLEVYLLTRFERAARATCSMFGNTDLVPTKGLEPACEFTFVRCPQCLQADVTASQGVRK